MPPSDQDAEKILRFEQLSYIVLSTTLLPVNDSIVAVIENTRDPKMILEMLAKKCKTVSHSNRIVLLDRFYASKIMVGARTVQFKAQLSEIVAHLASVSHKVPDKDDFRAVLLGFQEEYSVTVEIIFGMNKSLTEELTILITKEITLETEESFDATNKAVINSKKMSQKNHLCHFCSLKGLIKTILLWQSW